MDIFSYLSITDIKLLDYSSSNLVPSSYFFKPSTMALVWIIIYSSDWIMNYWGAKLYFKQVKKFCLFEQGYNLKHLTIEDIEKPGRILLRFLSELFLSTFAFWLLLYTCRLYSGWRFYELFCGYFILMEACVHFRHVRCVTVFSLMRKNCGFYGSIAVPKWMTLRNAFIEFATFGIGFLIVFFFDCYNFFVLGGVLACFSAMLYNFSVSEREKRRFLATNPEVTILNDYKELQQKDSEKDSIPKSKKKKNKDASSGKKRKRKNNEAKK